MKKQPKKLLDQVRDAIRLKHYSIRTEHSYVGWVKRFILYHSKQHPKDMGAREIEDFLTHLAVDLKVASSTQNQAFNALLFLYHEVLKIELRGSINAIRAKKPRKLPTVLTKSEASRVIAAMDNVYSIMAVLMYGSGLRLMECLRLRVKDVDFGGDQIVVRDGKGSKDRVTVLPKTFLKIQDQVRFDDITCMRAQFIKPSKRPPVSPGFQNPLAAIRFGTALQPICSKPVMTFAPSRSSWAIRMSLPP